MDLERRKQVDRILRQALSRPPASLKSFLDEACAGDDVLRCKVESLIEHDRKAGSFLDSPAPVSAAAGHAEQSHPDFVGRTLLHYNILEKIGEGGMGVVYRAEDSHLKRSVAIKLLPPEKMADPERKKRFIHEARAASALNHPNIITIHDISSADGIDFIAMEYVAGKPLSQLIGEKGLSLQEALKCAIQIADALEKAHKAGIIHRDLKPSNIVVTGDGLVKILDFGLAKLVRPSNEKAPDQTKSSALLTQSGLIVGTVAYMSPEQAEGKSVDARSDIFSFGAVLYEMVTGRRAFKGDSIISTLAAVVHKDPEPLSRIAGGIPPELERIIARCLKKDPERRFQHMDDAKIALEELKEESGKHRRLKPFYWIAAAALGVLIAGIWAFLHFLPREAEGPPAKIVPLTASAGEKEFPSLSPDGNWLAFGWSGEKLDNLDIYVKEVDGAGFNRLTTDPEHDSLPTWSPDGRQIAFFRDAGDHCVLYLISPMGGPERRLMELEQRSRLSWSPDGKNIAFADRLSEKGPWSIWSVSVDTLERTQLTYPATDSFNDRHPAYSPDGRYLAFIRYSEVTQSQIYITPLPRGTPRLVTGDNWPQTPCWIADGRELVFATSLATGQNGLWRISIDGGEPRQIATRGDKVLSPHISRNRLVYTALSGNSDIWRLNLTGEEATRPPSAPLPKGSREDECVAHISPDGQRIAFVGTSSGSAEIWSRNIDGTTQVRLTDMKAKNTGSPRWSPDGKLIAFDSVKYGNTDLFIMSAEGGPVRRITTDPTDEAVPRWSRDGRWIYFGSNRSGKWQIWKMPSEGGKAIQITKDGGFAGVESEDGHLYYSAYQDQKRGVWRIPLSGGPETLVTEAVIYAWGYWDLTESGIYFLDGQLVPSVHFYDFATRRVKDLEPGHADPRFDSMPGLSVSPDRKWLVYSCQISVFDIMMIDNFR